MTDHAYAAALSADMLEKLYYFALRKTGSKTEAEDLAQEIALQALASLANGSRPDDFERWAWTIARNRYARWADAKRRRADTAGNDDKLAIVPDDEPSAEERLVRTDDIAALRRELSLLASGYREIVVAYYFDGERIADIAARLGLPEGTVKRRLHDCRINMREGIEMAREVGTRSFKAEQVSFSKSGPGGKDGSPWRLIERLIPKNILLAAYRNPLSLEELCLELGVSMPYMEEEVKLLTEGTLLKEVTKGRYETDFIIVDKEMQLAIFRIAEDVGKRFAPALITLLDDVVPELRRVTGRKWDRDFLLWTLIPMTVDTVASDVRRANGWSGTYSARPHDGSWDLVGYEDHELPYGFTVGHHGAGNEAASMWCYKFGLPNLYDRAGELTDYEVAVLASALRSGRKRSELGAVEREVIGSLTSRGFLAELPEAIEPLFPVLTGAHYERLRHFLSHPALGTLRTITDGYYRSVYEIIGRGCPDRLREQSKFVSGEYLFNMRMFSLRYALDQGFIAVPERPDKSTIAMYMTLR